MERLNDLQKIMAQNAEILTRLEALDHLLRSLWEDPQLDRIEDALSHLRYGNGHTYTMPVPQSQWDDAQIAAEAARQAKLAPTKVDTAEVTKDWKIY